MARALQDDGATMNQPLSAPTSAVRRAGGTGRRGAPIGAAFLAWTCLLCCSPLAAQPGYRPSTSGYSRPAHYPAPPPGFRGGRPYECDLFARDQAELYVPQGAGMGAGAVRGAVGGAVFGAIVGGGKGARRGALVGGGLGAVTAGARARQEREIAYQLAYDDCMQGFRR
jgi:hypothetical protein